MRKSIKICIVGDKLKEFKRNKNVRGLSEFKKFIQKLTPSQKNKWKVIAIIGQGLSDQNIYELKSEIQSRALDNIQLIKASNNHVRGTKKLTHKHKLQNNMISIPEELDNDTYQSHLLLDENCDDMNDHITGQHIQGMLLIEAARQMTLAVTEKYYLDDDCRGNVAFVTNSVNVNFSDYVFPCDAKIIYTILEQRSGLGVNMKFKGTVKFIQSNKVKTIIEYDFSTLEKKPTVEKEVTMAQESITHFLDTYAGAA